MKKLVLVLVVLVSTMVQGSNNSKGVIPGKGTGDRIILKDTRPQRVRQSVLDFLDSKSDDTNLNEPVLTRSEILYNYQKDGYKMFVQSSGQGYSIYIMTKGYSSVGLTFEGNKLIDKVVTNL